MVVINNITDLTIAESILAASGMLVLSLSGVTVYTLVIFLISKHWDLFNNTFYRYLLSLGVSDSIMLLLFLLYCVPVTGFQLFPNDNLDNLMGILALIAYYSACPTMMSIGLNRYWAVCKNHSYNFVFNNKNVATNIVLVWVFGFLAATPQLFGYIRLQYDFGSFSWAYDLSKEWAWEYVYFEQMFTALTTLVLLVSYFFILLEMRRQDRQVAEAEPGPLDYSPDLKQELKLSLQFLGVGIYVIIFDITFNVLPLFSTYRWHMYIISIMYILNSCINPYVYLTTNYQLRLEAKILLGWAKRPDPPPEQSSEEHAVENKKPVAQRHLYLVPAGPYARSGKLNNAQTDLKMVTRKKKEAKKEYSHIIIL